MNVHFAEENRYLSKRNLMGKKLFQILNSIKKILVVILYTSNVSWD